MVAGCARILRKVPPANCSKGGHACSWGLAVLLMMGACETSVLQWWKLVDAELLFV